MQQRPGFVPLHQAVRQPVAYMQAQPLPQAQPVYVQAPPQAYPQAAAPARVPTSLSGRRRDLARQVGEAVQLSALGIMAGPVPTFQCKICLSNLPLVERVLFQECSDPEHGCCRECTKFWMEERIRSGQVHTLLCERRGNVECRARATEDEIQSLTDEDVFAKYKRFKQLRDDETTRECPTCGQLCKPEVVSGEIRAEMVCPSCLSSFCYFHSNAHTGRPCDEYSRQISRQLREMKTGALAGSKQCPKCGVFTQKTSGCNHMTCAERTCQAHWCWVCGEEIVGGANGVLEHYSTGTCRQFPDVDEVTTPGCWLTFLRIFTFPFRIFFLLLGSVLLVLCIALSPVTLLMVLLSANTLCRRRRDRVNNQTFIKVMLMIPGFVVFTSLTIVYMLVVAVVVLVLMFGAFILWQFFGCCLPDGCGEFDHTHLIWLWSLPFISLEPLRPCLRCYFQQWRCCGCCGDSDSDSAEEGEGGGTNADDDNSSMFDSDE